MPNAKVKCEKCNVRIPKNRPMLRCSVCDAVKHYKCNGLTKREAFEIIESQPNWTCIECTFDILPINLLSDIKNKLEICDVCHKKISSSTIVSKCFWCHNRCHRTCINGSLGCMKCCSDIVPGFGYCAHDLYGETFLDSKPLFNPWDQQHLINQLGVHNVMEDEQAIWNDISDVLSQCKYKTLKSLPQNCNGSPRILSLNIRSLFKGIDYLREEIEVFHQKCDIICLSETNLKLESLPNGTDDISLEGFHEPIFKDPYRTSGKGGGLVIYVNKNFCDNDSITTLELDDPVDPNINDSNPPGEFLFVKIGVKINGNNTKNLIIGNIYRSPSSSMPKFIERLGSQLQKLERHKNKIIHLVGDFNVDLANYDNDLHCHDLINKMAEHNFAQIISLPTRVTDHSATIIDHVYSNQIHTLVTSCVITLDISDHLGTYVQFNADPKFEIDKTATSNNPKTDYINFRKFNAVNIKKFSELIGNESWGAVELATSADEKYEQFIELYNKHYNESFKEIPYGGKIRGKIPNLGFCHG